VTVNCAHRGDPTNCPEATLVGFRRAVDLGVEMVELDVHLTADNALVVMHDFAVDRTTDGSGAIAELTLAQIKSFSAGIKRGAEFAQERVPTFEEAVAVLPAPMHLNIHLKTRDEHGDRGFEERFLQALHDTGAQGRCHIVHDWLESLDRVRAAAPELPCCWLPMCGDGFEYIRRAKLAGFSILQPGREMMSEEFCRAVHEAGMVANVFYANSAQDMRQYIAWGIDGILTDDPTLLQEVLGRPQCPRTARS
jgi:glycerophosphoryl diester phosphodiesterase